MVEIMTREASSCDLKELVGKFIPEAIGKLLVYDRGFIYMWSLIVVSSNCAFLFCIKLIDGTEADQARSLQPLQCLYEISEKALLK